MKNTQPRKKGFSFLSFFLGILLGIIILAGAIAGVGYYVLTADLDNVFKTVKVDNKDSEGNYKYVNTDTENGGVKNLLELVKTVSSFASNGQEKTIGDIETLLPVTKSFVNSVSDALKEYIDVNKEEMKAVKFADFGNYFKDLVLDIQPATLMDKFNVEVDNNKLVEVMLCGAEAEYVEYEGYKYPVWYYDNGTKDDDDDIYFYKRDEKIYKLEKDGADYILTDTEYEEYDVAKEKLTGNFYYENGDGETARINVSPVTIRSLTEGGDALGPLERVKVASFLKNVGDDDMVKKVLGDTSVGDLVNGKANFTDKINSIELSDIIAIDPTNNIVSYLGFGVVDLEAKEGETYAYVGTYKPIDKEEEEISPCYVEVGANGEGSKITRVYYVNGEGEEVTLKGTTVNQVSKRVDGVTNDIKISQLMTIGDNKLLNAIADSTVNSLSDDISKLSINELYADEVYGVEEKNDDGTTTKLPAVMKEVGKDITFNEDYLYYVKVAEGKYKMINSGTDNAGKLTQSEYEGRGDTVYYTYGATTTLWKMLLCERGGDIGARTYSEKVYNVNSMGDMINNVTHNIQGTTMRELHEAGIITFSKPEQLDEKICYFDRNSMSIVQSDKIIGSMELIEFINFVVENLTSANQMFS